jgi:hypothetical protein
MSTEVKELKFTLGTGLDELPARHYAKGSKYDVILDTKLIKRFTPISIEGKDGNYIRTQLMKVITSRKLANVGVAVSNGICYLVKEPTPKVKLHKA